MTAKVVMPEKMVEGLSATEVKIFPINNIKLYLVQSGGNIQTYNSPDLTLINFVNKFQKFAEEFFVNNHYMNTSVQKMNRGPTGRPPLKNKKSVGEQDYEEDFGLLAETLRIIDSIYEMRFIEKISRPIERRVKEEYVEKVAGKMEILHAKL